MHIYKCILCRGRATVEPRRSLCELCGGLTPTLWVGTYRHTRKGVVICVVCIYIYIYAYCKYMYICIDVYADRWASCVARLGKGLCKVSRISVVCIYINAYCIEEDGSSRADRWASRVARCCERAPTEHTGKGLCKSYVRSLVYL